MSRSTFLCGAALLALNCAVAAQTPPAKPADPKAPQAAAPAPVASSGHTTGIARASNLIGLDIVDTADKDVGEVKDIFACGQSGEMVLIIERKGGDLVAAPMSLFSTRVDQDDREDKAKEAAKEGAVAPLGTVKVEKLVLVKDADKLATAPVIPDKDKFSSLDDAWWKHYCENYALPAKGHERDAAAAAADGKGLVCVEKLIGQDVKTAAGEDIGDVKDVAVDLGTNKVAYVVIATGGVMGVGDTLHGVSVETLIPDAEHKYVTLNADKAALERIEGIDLDRLPARPTLLGAAKPSSSDRNEKERVTPR